LLLPVLINEHFDQMHIFNPLPAIILRLQTTFHEITYTPPFRNFNPGGFLLLPFHSFTSLILFYAIRISTSEAAPQLAAKY